MKEHEVIEQLKDIERLALAGKKDEEGAKELDMNSSTFSALRRALGISRSGKNVFGQRRCGSKSNPTLPTAVSDAIRAKGVWRITTFDKDKGRVVIEF